MLVIDGVLSIPGNITSVLDTAQSKALQDANMTAPLSAASGVTVLVPDYTALASANLGSLSSAQMDAIWGSHVSNT